MIVDDGQHVSTPHDKPLRRADLVLEELDGEAVLYDARCGAVHRFDALTLFVWEVCDGSHSAADIGRAVAAAYDVDADDALRHVDQLIADFCTRDLLANGCGTLSKVPRGQTEGPTVRAIAERSGAATAGRQPEGTCGPVSRSVPHSDLPSRRAVLRGGAKKLAFAAPVVSTFFARPAYASNPIHPAVSAFGAGGCKNPGYSCTTPDECCGGAANTRCDGGTCCIKHVKGTCYRDEDCCDYPVDSCIAGTCQ